jgi:hypothetical protein
MYWPNSYKFCISFLNPPPPRALRRNVARVRTLITCNFTRQQIADHMDARIASRLGRGNNAIVDNINVLDYTSRSHEEGA